MKFEEATTFVRKLFNEENLPAMEIAKTCGISWQVAQAILRDDSYVMGSVNERKILRRKIEWDKSEKRSRDFAAMDRLDAISYKGTREINHHRNTNRLEQMKSL